jgi:solute carrier family 25 carnitine/acylcarnitine transporter 20/29
MCRFFKSMKPPPPPPQAYRNRHHDSLIDEAEAELASGLTWPELMAAGGVAGVTAWLVSLSREIGMLILLLY